MTKNLIIDQPIIEPEAIQLLNDFKYKIEQGLNELILSQSKNEPLISPLKYIFQSGGKRIRAIFVLSLLKDLGEEIDQHLPAALSVELLHLASLVHDDLPALDNDNLRRGLKTCHVEFNEATAILAADFLIALSFGQLAASNISAKVFPDVISIFSKAFQKLCSGQQLDLNRGQGTVDNFLIAQFKTGALFSATFALPLMIAELPKYLVSLAEEAGIHVGVCYQVCDDFADQIDSLNLKGRKDSSDQRNAKETFSSENYIELSRLQVSASWQKVNDNLSLISQQLKLKNDLPNTRAALSVLFQPFSSLFLVP